MRCYYCNAMVYVPPIHGYKPFYIQAESDSTAWDTTTCGLVAQTQPFPDNYEVKDPYKNDWLDEDGDEEYVADMHRKAFEFTVKFYVKTYPVTGQNAKTAIQVLNGQVADFRGKIIPGEFKIWDSWQEKGFQCVRFVKDSVENREITEDYAWMILAVTFKVNDPSTEVSFDSTSNTINTPSQQEES